LYSTVEAAKAIYKHFYNSKLGVISMREYVLTSRERRILEAFIESGMKLNGFSVLAIRLKRARKRLIEDMMLITATLEKLEAS